MNKQASIYLAIRYVENVKEITIELENEDLDRYLTDAITSLLQAQEEEFEEELFKH